MTREFLDCSEIRIYDRRTNVALESCVPLDESERWSAVDRYRYHYDYSSSLSYVRQTVRGMTKE